MMQTKISKVMQGMTLVKEDYATADIIEAIKKCDSLYRTDTARVAQKLRRNTDYETVKAVFQYVMEHVTYKLDSEGIQLARRPSRTIQEGKGDCKSFSLLAGSLLYNLGINYTYRFASYRSDPTPTHVYVVANTKTQNILVDGVWKIFNSEKPYRFKTDIQMKGLYIGALPKTKRYAAVIGSIAINGLGDIGKRSRGNSSNGGKKTKGKFFKKIKKGLKKFGNLNKMALLAAPRNAFLLLVKINFRDFAKKLSTADNSRLFNTWEKLGGKVKALQAAINKGKSKKRIMGIGSTIYVPASEISGVGEIGSVAAVVASATAIILKLKSFLPKGATKGVKKEDVDQAEAMNQSLDSGNVSPAQAAEFNDSTATMTTKAGSRIKMPDVESQDNDVATARATSKPGASLDDSEPSSSGGGSGTPNNKMLIIGGAAALGLFLVMKKK